MAVYVGCRSNIFRCSFHSGMRGPRHHVKMPEWLVLRITRRRLLFLKFGDSDNLAGPVMMADSSSSQYIRLVQHLIEECILFNMGKEECMDALSKHANIKPVITATVWKELEKENKEFFEAYNKNREERASEAETRQRIKKMLLDSSTKDDSTDDD
ncbi:OLC1v1034748C1 [Oldenlandia corymbosa var. corymbosa]|uniref:OLC1v1034748C1 n=1 Tax=Oldenlandia corymbosa var. corymbosa TaxID=529605 RepID=A0AAV1CRD9_OLDCO|nr:OLC1v1034748C1 [Oldenlandia corymbosa var. corymbosa]